MYHGNYMEYLKEIKEAKSRECQFWVSVKNINKCLFSRRNGYLGKIILNHSICVRLFGFNLI